MNQQPLGRRVAPVSILLCGLLLPLALALVAIVPGVPVQAAGNTITLATVTAPAGSSGSFAITLDNSDAVASGQVRFTYAASLGMTITGVQVTSRTTGFTNTGNAYNTGNASLLGYQVLFYNLNSLTIAPGTGAMLTISYTTAANASGNTALAFTQALLASTAAQALPVTPVNGTFTITAPTATATATTIPSATPTNTAISTATATSTSTATPTATTTNTPLPTATSTTIPTPTPTKTATATATSTPTATPTATNTAVNPATATNTATATTAATATNTATASSTPASGSTATATGTPLPTATATGTTTPTPTNTATSTATNTATVTATPSSVPTTTATKTPLPTATDTPLPTPTATETATATSTPTTTATTTATPTATPTATNTPQASPTPAATLIYVSSSRNGRVDGLVYRDEDILAYDELANRWQILFDGSDVGVANADLDAFTLLDDGSILMSFDKPMRFPAFGVVDDSDLVRFIPLQWGVQTIGTFEFFFDGSDVDLTTAGEDIDAVSYTREGTLLISVYGVAEVGGVRGRDEDLLRFTPTAVGVDTAGSWDLYFDGSAVGLASGDEDISAATLDAQGALYLATKGNFNVSSLTAIQGDSDDLFGCTLRATGDNATACTFFAFFDGDLVRFNRPIDGVALATGSSLGITAAQNDPESGPESGDGEQFEVLPDDPVTDDEEFDSFDELQTDETPLEDMQLYLPIINR